MVQIIHGRKIVRQLAQQAKTIDHKHNICYTTLAMSKQYNESIPSSHGHHPNDAFTPLEKTPYYNHALSERDPIKAQIQGYLADVTFPLR